MDLRTTVTIVLEPGQRMAVPTGLAVAIPAGHAGLVLPRSGHARNSGISLVNSPGLIDAGYRGEIEVLLINQGSEPVSFRRGDRVAQLMIIPLPKIEWVEVDVLGETGRGTAGFGSTGL